MGRKTIFTKRTITVCDVCGKEVTNSDETILINIHLLYSNRYASKHLMTCETPCYLCKDCAGKFYDYLLEDVLGKYFTKSFPNHNTVDQGYWDKACFDATKRNAIKAAISREE